MVKSITDKPLPLVKVFGRRGSSRGYKIRDFLHRCDSAFEWVELDTDAVARVLGLQDAHDARLPLCLFADGAQSSPVHRRLDVFFQKQ